MAKNQAPAEPESTEEPERELTPIEQLELDNGFRFGDPDNEAGTTAPTISLICRDPECSMSGQHVAVHRDTVQPIHCGGLITLPDGGTRPCSAVLLCDHETATTSTTAGTLGAPVKITVTKCTKCGTITEKLEEQQPPIPLADLPVSMIEALTGEPIATADESTA